MNESAIVELVVVVFVTIAVGLGGVWYGYYLAKRRDDRLRAADVAIAILSDQFTKMRLHFRDELRREDADLARYSDMQDLSFVDLRRDITTVLNYYDVVCYLHANGDLDQRIFDDKIRPQISHDYKLLDGYLRQVELHQLHRGGDLRRPFFKSISDVVGR